MSPRQMRGARGYDPTVRPMYSWRVEVKRVGERRFEGLGFFHAPDAEGAVARAKAHTALPMFDGAKYRAERAAVRRPEAA